MIVLPGAVETEAQRFALATVMQTGKIRRRPIFLIGRDFWQPSIDVDKKQMLGSAHGGNCPDGLEGPLNWHLLGTLTLCSLLIKIISRKQNYY